MIENSVRSFIEKNKLPIPGAKQSWNDVQDISEREKHVVLVSCSKRKRFSPCSAELLYDSSDLFRKSLAYAKSISKDIRILSAKYGLIKLNDIIEPYNETLNEKSKEELAVWGKETAKQIFECYDLPTTKFVILAGMNYYGPLMRYLPEIKLPLLGMPIGKRMAMLDYLLMSGKLHKLFNDMPRYSADTINEIGFDNGIYIVFEDTEKYYDMDRIVRVGTHLSDGRLKGRLKDHFWKENKDGSIFRKNIGRAILNRSNHVYLDSWNINTSRSGIIEKMGNKHDAEFEQRLEMQISRYMKENFTFVCFPVETMEERLRLKEGIIASLNIAPDFAPSVEWRGKYSPENEIKLSGMWLKEGLSGKPLQAIEYEIIESYCRSEATHL